MGSATGRHTNTSGIIPRRALGNTGREVSALGIGCSPIGSISPWPALRILRRALDLGIDYFDVAPQYQDAETKLGKALRGRREDVFIATKVFRRSRADAAAEFRHSRENMGFETVDLLQLHAINTMAELDAVTRRDGALTAVIDARRSGRVRHIGITGHRDPSVLLAALDRFDFETVLIPVGLADSHINDFESALKPLCRQRGVAVIQMKLLAAGRLNPVIPPRDALRWGFSRPDHAVSLVGVERLRQVREAVEIISRLSPPTPEEESAWRDRSISLAQRRQLWWKL